MPAAFASPLHARRPSTLAHPSLMTVTPLGKVAELARRRVTRPCACGRLPPPVSLVATLHCRKVGLQCLPSAPCGSFDHVWWLSWNTTAFPPPRGGYPHLRGARPPRSECRGLPPRVATPRRRTSATDTPGEVETTGAGSPVWPSGGSRRPLTRAAGATGTIAAARRRWRHRRRS